MSKKVLIVVDMQKDFIDGALGTKEAAAIVDNVVKRIQEYEGEVVFTKDTHFENYLETSEGRHLPVTHCIKGTAGWEFDEKIENVKSDDMKVFEKITFGSTKLGEYLKTIKDLEEVELVGLCTDICVISNALLIKAFLPEIKVVVRENCTAGVTVKSHCNAIAAMKMCQIEIL